MWAALAPIGRDPRTGGYRRTSFEPVERACVAWFAAEARRRDLRVDADGNGNLVAWWWPPGARERPIISGSHLDSVPDGGAFDGPLGVVSALAALDVLRARHFRPRRPIGIAVFAEEEGARIGVACLGSRLLTGMLPVDAASGAGHDAGIFAAAGIPSAMLFVRNPTGVSHAPAEAATTADCRAGIEALATVLAGLAG